MQKKSLLIPLLSTALLAPVFLAGHVAAEEVTATAGDQNTPVLTPASETPTASTETATPSATSEATSSASAGTEANTAAAPQAAPAATSADTDETEAVILHTNDVHGRIVEEKNVIGDAKLATVIKETRANNKNTLIVDAGDAFQGLPISNSSKGEERAKILNAIGYDAMAVGNHEFDFGLDEVKKYKELLNFPLLSSNTYIDGARLFEAYTIVDKDKTVKGDEFVVIGVTTPETGTKTHPKNVKGVTFTEPIAEVEKVVAEIESKAKAEGVEYKNYVILAHLGIDTTTPNEWRGSALGEALSKNEALKGKRVILIDGHSHTVATATYGENVTYNQTGSYLHNIGKITLKSNQLLAKTEMLPASEVKSVTPDPEILAMVEKVKAAYEADNAKVIRANNPVEFNGDRENVRVRETNLGNLVSDALYQYGQTGFKEATDIVVTNGGGLRETLKANADITKGDVIAVLPFGNTITQIQVSGQDIKDMFVKSLGSIHQVDKDGNKILDENGLPLLEPSGGFLHVAGVKVYYNTEKEGAERVLAIKVLDHKTGKYLDLDLKKTYNLLTNDFIAAGGDGYTMFGSQPREEGPSMDEAFADYLKKADLTLADYAKVNPNLRLIATREVPAEDADKQKDNQVNPGGVYLPSQPADEKGQALKAQNMSYQAPAAPASAGQKVLPQTGQEASLLMATAAAVLGFLGLSLLKKKEEN